MTTFKQFYLESRDYHLAHDPQVLLYDFYVLSYLRSLKLKETQHIKSFVSKDVEELTSLITDAEPKLLPVIKKETLDAVFYSICSEMRQVIGFPLDTAKLANITSPTMFALYQAINQAATNPLRESGDEDLSDITRDQMVNLVDTQIKALGTTRFTFVDLALLMFTHFGYIWDLTAEMKTGKVWAAICSAWKRLAISETPEHQYIAIDHVYDLHHMSGSVFNKVPRYLKNGSISWMKTALDFKAGIDKIEQLLPFCSSDLRKIALMSLKVYRTV